MTAPKLDHLTREQRDKLRKLQALRRRVEAEILALALPPTTQQGITRRSRHLIPDCGTETAYQRHTYRARKFGEPYDADACDCRQAHAAHEAEKRAARAKARAAALDVAA